MQGILQPFEPHPMIAGPILQTICGARLASRAYLPRREYYKLRIDDFNALVFFRIPPRSESRPTVLLAHGMGGCSESGYMRRIAARLAAEGFGVVMMNHRGSGQGMGLCNRLWNGGSSEDLRCVLQFLIEQWPWEPLLAIGFSLSGNVLLKYLGETKDVPSQMRGALAVNPPIDLKVASRLISEGPHARLFNNYYMTLINQQACAVAECHPATRLIPPSHLQTIFEFDEAYTAEAAGFSSSDEYYERSSASRFLAGIRVPTVILSSSDDPFVPSDVFNTASVNLDVRCLLTNAGGHMGYISKNKTPLGDRRWMDYAVLEWAKLSV